MQKQKQKEKQKEKQTQPIVTLKVLEDQIIHHQHAEQNS